MILSLVVGLALGLGASAPLPSVAVFRFETRDVNPSLGAVAYDLVVDGLNRSGAFSRVAGQKEMEAALGLAAEKQRMGCDTDSCVAEIAAALGADLLVVGAISGLGNQWVVTLRLVRTLNGTTVSSVHAAACAVAQEQLVGLAPVLVSNMLVGAGMGTDPLPVPDGRCTAEQLQTLRRVGGSEAVNNEVSRRRQQFLDRALLFAWEEDRDGAKVAVLKRGGVVLGQEELDALQAPEPEQPERGSLVPVVARTLLLALPLPLPILLIPTCGVAGLVVGLVTWAVITLALVLAGAPVRLVELGGAVFLPYTQTWSVFGGLVGVAAAAVLIGGGGLVTVLSGWTSTLKWLAVPSHTWAEFARLHNTRLAVEMGLTRKTLPPQYFPH